MMNIHHLLESIQRDARSTIKRWSMRELASQNLRLSVQPPVAPIRLIEDTTAFVPKLYHDHHPIHNHNNDNKNNYIGSDDGNVSSVLLQCIVQRLAVQHESLRLWKQALQETLSSLLLSSTNNVVTTPSTVTTTSNTKKQTTTIYNSVLKRIDTLQYIHYDTYRIGQQILYHHPSQILVRQTRADQHVIHTTFLEIRARHAKSIETIVDIVSDLRRQPQPQSQSPSQPDLLSKHSTDDDHHHHHHDNYKNNERMAEDFLRRRLGIQLLCDHHVALYKGQNGIRIQAPFLKEVLPDAIQETKHLVDAHLPMVPDVIIEVMKHNPDLSNQHQHPVTTDTNVTTTTTTTSKSSTIHHHHHHHEKEMTCTIVQPWVHHAIVELLKNAMSSTVRQYILQYHNNNTTTTKSTTLPPPPLPPVYIKCYDTPHSIIIDIVDAGMGIQEEDLDTVFLLGHTTAALHRYDRLNEQQSYASIQIPPLSSLGVGVPISQYYIEHFGGTVQLWNNNNHHDKPNFPFNQSTSHTTATTTNDTTTSKSSTGCTARIELVKDDTILERFTPL